MSRHLLLVTITAGLCVGAFDLDLYAQAAAAGPDSPFLNVLPDDPAPKKPEAATDAPADAAAPAEAAPVKQTTAAEAQKIFDDLFGGELKRVEATPESADDLALAKTLLVAAQSDAQNAKLVSVLCRNVALLAANDPDGGATSKAALDLLRETDPDQVAPLMSQLVDTLQRRYNMTRGPQRTQIAAALLEAIVNLGDTQLAAHQADDALNAYRRAYSIATSVKPDEREAIKTKMNEASDLQRIVRQIDLLKAKLKANSKDTAAARDLILLYVADLNDAIEARKYTFLVDSELADNVRRATLDTADLTEDDAFKLGEWYRGLAGQATNEKVRGELYRSAYAAYERYLEAHKTEDLYQARVVLAAKQVREQMDKLGVKPIVRDEAGWVNLIPLTRPGVNVDPDEWRVLPTQISVVGEPRSATYTLPAAVRGDYELELQFKYTSGDSMYVELPIGAEAKKFVSAVFGYHDDDVTYNAIGGIGYSIRADTHPARVIGPIATDATHQATFKVTHLGEQVTVAVTLDGKPYLSWTGLQATPAAYPSGARDHQGQPRISLRRTQIDLAVVRARPGKGGKVLTGDTLAAAKAAIAAANNGNGGKPAAPKSEMQKKFDYILEHWNNYTNKEKLQILAQLRESGHPAARQLIEDLDDRYGL
ncbi:MAG: hypothetical protein GC159_17315 [Phycisphaera sp.]|nr:hypothetical protein [Phycisphaera sp.]